MAQVLLDGHNIIRREHSHADEAAREQLIRDAALYRSGRKVSVTVVFDSPHGSGTAGQTPYAGVRVEYAKGEADRLLIAKIRRSRSPQDILVVTSDRDLAAEARSLGARTQDVDEFRQGLTRRRPRKLKAPLARVNKPVAMNPDEVDYWEKQFAKKKEPEEEEEW